MTPTFRVYKLPTSTVYNKQTRPYHWIPIRGDYSHLNPDYLGPGTKEGIIKANGNGFYYIN
jgi:hypothetical protein